MQRRTNYLLSLGGALFVAVLLFFVVSVTQSKAVLGSDISTQSVEIPSVESALAQDVTVVEQAGRQVILEYPAKFVCTEAVQPGTYHYGLNVPLVSQKTDVLIHNPWPYPVTLFKKAVEAPIEKFTSIEQGVPPGKWQRVTLLPDYAFRIDCDDIAKLLTGNKDATFLSQYGVGNTKEGFVVLAIGQQTAPGTTLARYGSLDVTADYVRSSEFLKKDINYQPWWTYWWWTLPWRLGYPYERVVHYDATKNIDCIQSLHDALVTDVQNSNMETSEIQGTITALDNGAKTIVNGPNQLSSQNPPALVPLIGRCQKIDQEVMEIDYALVSNKGSTDPDPRNGGTANASQVLYPWIPGRWYDLAAVVPQNVDVDIRLFFNQWQVQRWVTAGEDLDNANKAIAYYFPYWCGWGYWWWWWNSGDCIDIGVGNSESLDVEQITPTRVLVQQLPPN